MKLVDRRRDLGVALIRAQFARDEGGRLVRRVAVLGVDVLADIDGKRFRLTEDRQVFSDGRVRRRTTPTSISEKLKLDENVQEAVIRAMSFDWNPQRDKVLLTNPQRKENEVTYRLHRRHRLSCRPARGVLTKKRHRRRDRRRSVGQASLALPLEGVAGVCLRKVVPYVRQGLRHMPR